MGVTRREEGVAKLHGRGGGLRLHGEVGLPKRRRKRSQSYTVEGGIPKGMNAAMSPEAAPIACKGGPPCRDSRGINCGKVCPCCEAIQNAAESRHVW